MEYGLNEGKVCHHEPLKSCDHVNIESQIKKGTSGALKYFWGTSGVKARMQFRQVLPQSQPTVAAISAYAHSR